LSPGRSIVSQTLDPFAAVGVEEKQAAARGDGNRLAIGSNGQRIRLIGRAKAQCSQPRRRPGWQRVAMAVEADLLRDSGLVLLGRVVRLASRQVLEKELDHVAVHVPVA